jgi:glycosyltransferase involved in cell wall biosynthesis
MRVTYYYPWGLFHPIRSGAAVVADRHLSYFRARGFRPRVIVLGTGTAEAQAAFEKHYNWVEDVHVFPPERSAAVQRNYEVWDFGRFLAAHAAIANVPEFRDVLGLPTDLVFLNYAFSAPLLEATPRAAPRVLESHDIISRQFLRQRNSPALLEHHLSVEFALYQLFDAALMINEEEAAFAEQRGVTNSQYMPRGMDVADAKGGYEYTGGARYDLLFVGSNHGPNVEGARRFYDQVFAPRLKSRGMRWAIVGSVCQQLEFRDPAVTMLGQVEDLDDVYRRSKVVVVPLFSGTGTSIKTLEAMAQGKPVVSTPCGVRGIPNCEEQVVTFDFDGSPSLVAEAIAELCQSRALRESYAQKSIAYVLKNFGPLNYCHKMDTILAPLLSSRAAPTPLSIVRAA